ncbi:MAG: hypothetical protein ACKN9P_08375 [Phenylobacterium sp.]
MTDAQNTLGEDIAYLKTLAEEGRAAPVLAGPYMALGGGLFGLTSLLAYAITAGFLPLPAQALGWIWPASGLAFVFALPLLNRRTRSRLGSASTLNETIGVIWTQAGMVIGVLFCALLFAGFRTSDWGVFNLFPSVILALYGLCWMAAAHIGRTPWLRRVGIGSFIASVAIAGQAAGGPLLWLAYAIALFALGLAPGLQLMRQEGRR